MNMLPPPRAAGPAADRIRCAVTETITTRSPRALRTGRAFPPRDIPHLMVPELRKRLHWNDPHEWRVNNWIEPWDWQSQFDVGLISVPSSKTSILANGAYGAPNSIKESWAINTTYTPDYDVDLAELKVREIGDVATPVIDLRQGIVDIEESLAVFIPARVVPADHHRW